MGDTGVRAWGADSAVCAQMELLEVRRRQEEEERRRQPEAQTAEGAAQSR